MILTGRSIHIRPLDGEDVERWHIPIAHDAIADHVAVHVEDLGECLAAVVKLTDNGGAQLVWSDADGEGTPIKHEQHFAIAVFDVVHAIVQDA